MSEPSVPEEWKPHPRGGVVTFLAVIFSVLLASMLSGEFDYFWTAATAIISLVTLWLWRKAILMTVSPYDREIWRGVVVTHVLGLALILLALVVIFIALVFGFPALNEWAHTVPPGTLVIIFLLFLILMKLK